MSGIKYFLGYQKQLVKKTISQWYYINRLRFKIRIAEDCFISSDFIFGQNVKIGVGVQIGGDVILGNNVIIGSNASISRIKVGNNSHIERGVVITGNGDGTIVIGEQSYIGINNILDWSGNITIGDYVHIAGPSTGLWTHSSAKQALNGLPLNDKDPEYRPIASITIESNVYIGGNCTIYPGVTIGHHSIVAPNSAVAKDVMPYTLVGGTPAVKIKSIEL